jgi:hypothetical protein
MKQCFVIIRTLGQNEGNFNPTPHTGPPQGDRLAYLFTLLPATDSFVSMALYDN